MNSFTSKNKSSRKQPIRPRRLSSLEAVQNPDPYGSQLFCFRARFQTLFYLFFVFPTNTLRSSKSCKVAPYMKKSRPRLKSHSPTRATLGEPTFPTFPYRNLALETNSGLGQTPFSMVRSPSQLSQLFSKQTLGLPRRVIINSVKARESEHARALFSARAKESTVSQINTCLFKLSWAGRVIPGKFFSI